MQVGVISIYAKQSVKFTQKFYHLIPISFKLDLQEPQHLQFGAIPSKFKGDMCC